MANKPRSKAEMMAQMMNSARASQLPAKPTVGPKRAAPKGATSITPSRKAVRRKIVKAKQSAPPLPPAVGAYKRRKITTKRSAPARTPPVGTGSIAGQGQAPSIRSISRRKLVYKK